MIHIDLLRGVQAKEATAEGVAVGAAGDFEQESFDVSHIDQKKTIINLLLILFFPTACVLFEKDEIEKKENVLANYSNKLVALKTQSKDDGALIAELEKFEKEKKALMSQIVVIEKLSRGRLREVKTLGTVQESMPSKAWLISLSVENQEVKLVGYAINDEHVSRLINDLERSVYFRNVELKKSVEQKTDRGDVKKFEVSFFMGDFE